MSFLLISYFMSRLLFCGKNGFSFIFLISLFHFKNSLFLFLPFGTDGAINEIKLKSSSDFEIIGIRRGQLPLPSLSPFPFLLPLPPSTHSHITSGHIWVTWGSSPDNLHHSDEFPWLIVLEGVRWARAACQEGRRGGGTSGGQRNEKIKL